MLENFIALGYDHILRTNIRLAYGKNHLRSDRPFLASTFGSHYIGLVDFVACAWNSLLEKEGNKNMTQLVCLPQLQRIATFEEIGVVSSDYVSSFGGLLTIKDEEDIEDVNLDMPLHENVAEDDVLRTLGIDPSSLLIPELRKPEIPQIALTPADGGLSSQQQPGLAGSLRGPEVHIPSAIARQTIVSKTMDKRIKY